MIKVDSLVKCFGTKRAVDGVSFSVERGEVLRFLGSNGAGRRNEDHVPRLTVREQIPKERTVGPD
jgi:ABC-type uncharacterized transport system ATPase subunit